MVDPAGNITGTHGAPPPVHVLPTKLAYAASSVTGWSAPSRENAGTPPSFGRGSVPVHAFPRVQVPAPGWDYYSRFTFGDVNGDGRTDYAYVSQPKALNGLVSGQTPLYVQTQLARSPGDDPGLGPISTQLTYKGPGDGDSVIAYIQGLLAADLNGDGRSDLIIMVAVINHDDSFWGTDYLIPAYSSGQPGHYTLGPPLGSDASHPDGTGIEAWFNSAYLPCEVADVNGDGLKDVVCLNADFKDWPQPSQAGPSFKLVTFLSSGYMSTAGQNFLEVDQPITLNDPSALVLMAVSDVDGSGLQSPVILDVDTPTLQKGASPHTVIVTARSLGNGHYDVSRLPTTWLAYGSVRVMSGDLTGNGVDDLVAIQAHNGSDTVSVETAVRQADGSYVLNSQSVTPTLPADGYEVTIGDATGDGRADLLFATPRKQGTGVHCDQPGQPGAPSTTMTTVVPLDGNGQFSFPARWDDCAYSHDLIVPWARGDTWDATAANNITAAADTDGSGLADELYVSWPPYPSGTDTTLVDDPVVDLGVDARKFVAVSLRSPGESNLVYPRDTGDGTVLHTYLRDRDGPYTHLDDQFFPRPGGRPYPAGWHALDVLGNGRTDLVYISNRMDFTGDASQLTIDTFLANGDGTWTELPIQPQATGGEELEPGRWRVVDLGPGPPSPLVQGAPAPANGDRFGLVYLGARLYTLVFDAATGTWDPWAGPNTADNPAAAGCPAQAADWLVADVNGDGRSDLILLCEDPSSGAVRLVTWLAASPGMSVPAQQDYTSSGGQWPDGIEPSNLAGWRVLDSNGDRMTDLAYLQQAPGGLIVSGLISAGNGGWIPQKPATVSPGPSDPDPHDPARWQDISRWQIAPPVPGDPQAGLLHVTQALDGIRVDTIRPSGDAPGWRAGLGTIQPITASAVPAGTPWLNFAAGTDGATDLVHLSISGPNLLVQPLADNSFPDLLTHVTTPLGGSVTLTYASSATWPAGNPHDGCYLPPGGALWAVSTETISNGLSPPATTTFRFAYDCPQWWGQERTFDGWRDAAITQIASAARPAVTTIAHYAVSRTGRHTVQAVATTTADKVNPGDLPSDPGTLLKRTTYGFEPAGDESLGFLGTMTCEESACQSANNIFLYDDFGNLKQVHQYGDNPPEYWSTRVLDRRVFFDYYLPPAGGNYTYQVGLISDMRVFGASPTSGPPLQETRYCYGPGGSCNTVAAQGLVTNILQLDEQDQNTWLSTKYEYDSSGSLIHVTDADGHGTSIKYDPETDLYPVWIGSDNLPQLQQHNDWDHVLGVLTGQTDANHATKTYGYDPIGRLTSVTYPNNGKELINYDKLMSTDTAQHDVGVMIPTGTPGGLWAREYIDGTGRPVKDEQPGPQGTGQITVTAYQYADATGPPSRISDPYGEQAGSPVLTTFAYDSLGRPAKETFPSGDQQTWTYSGGHGYLSVTAQHDGQTQENDFDAWGSPVAAIAYHGGQPLTTSYQYDAADELTAIKDPQGNTEQRSYDSLGRLRADSDADRGRWTYTYDNDGNLASSTDARSIQTTYSYDAVGRLKIRSHPGDPSQTVTLTYDGPQPDSIGHLTQVQDPSAAGCPENISETFGYDNMGHVTNWTKCVLGQQLAFSASYDSAGTGRISELKYPTSPQVAGNSPLTFSYNIAGEPQAVQPVIRDIQYSASQQQQDLYYGNNVHEHFTYDNLDRYTGDTVSDGTRRLLTDQIVPDPDGTVGSLTRSTDPTSGSGLLNAAATISNTSTAARDDLGRLTSLAGAGARQYTYNGSGGITTSSLLGPYSYPPQGPDGCGPQTPCAAPHAVRQAGTHTYSYDANGNRTMRDGQPLIWNDDNQLEWIRHQNGTWTHQIFDATGSLVYSNDQASGPNSRADSAAGATRIYGALEDTSQTSTTSRTARQYVYLGAALVAIRDTRGNHTVISDYQGSPELILNPARSIQATPRYGAYGDTTAPGLSSAGPGYLGAWSDSTTGLVLLGSRFYDPQLGQFISPDSKLNPATAPGSTNRYTYGFDDPLTFQDPTGYDSSDGESGGEGSDCPDSDCGYTDEGGIPSATSGLSAGLAGVISQSLGEASPQNIASPPLEATTVGSSQSTLGETLTSFGSGFAYGFGAGLALALVTGVGLTALAVLSPVAAVGIGAFLAGSGAAFAGYSAALTIHQVVTGIGSQGEQLTTAQRAGLAGGIAGGIAGAALGLAEVGAAGGGALTAEVSAGAVEEEALTAEAGAGAANAGARLEIQIGSKIEGQMAKRGWTQESVEDLIANPSQTVPTRDTRWLPGGAGRSDAPATAYINRTGGYVIRNNETGNIVQVSDLNDPNWKSPW